MEVCGTHTMVAFRTGLRQFFPRPVKLRSPVRAAPSASPIPATLMPPSSCARRPHLIVATFGDLAARSPGSSSSSNANARRAATSAWSIRRVTRCRLRGENPKHDIVFLGVGFETTGADDRLEHPAGEPREPRQLLRALRAQDHAPRDGGAAEGHDVNSTGFLCPGHVSVTRLGDVQFIAERYKIPCVVPALKRGRAQVDRDAAPAGRRASRAGRGPIHPLRHRDTVTGPRRKFLREVFTESAANLARVWE